MNPDAETRKRSLDAAFGTAHADDRYWSRPSDLAGIGLLLDAGSDGERIQVEIKVRNLVFYLDSSLLAAFGDLYNLKDIPFGARIAFSGNIRSLTDRGIRMGRLHVRPCDVDMEKAVLTPIRDEKHHRILFGEVCIPDPDPEQQSFLLAKDGAQILLRDKED